MFVENKVFMSDFYYLIDKNCDLIGCRHNDKREK